MTSCLDGNVLVENALYNIPLATEIGNAVTKSILVCSGAGKSVVLSQFSACTSNASSQFDESISFLDTRRFAESVNEVSERHDLRSLVIIDCRSQIDFGTEHIRSSCNINCKARLIARKLMTKRLEEIEPSLAGKLANSDHIIIYDDSTDVCTEDKLATLPINLVVKAAKRSKKKVSIIQGGFIAVKQTFPHLIEHGVKETREHFEQDHCLSTPIVTDKESFIMTLIFRRIYVGNLQDAQSLERLNQYEITHIINTTPDLPCVWKEKFTYKRIPVYDTPSQNIKSHFEAAINFIDEALLDKKNKILVHCSAGISRSPTLVLAYMIKKGLKFEEAFKEMKKRRPIIDPNMGFIFQLRDWENESLISTMDKSPDENIDPNSTNTQLSKNKYIGSSSKTKLDVRPCSDQPIVVQ